MERASLRSPAAIASKTTEARACYYRRLPHRVADNSPKQHCRLKGSWSALSFTSYFAPRQLRDFPARLAWRSECVWTLRVHFELQLAPTEMKISDLL